MLIYNQLERANLFTSLLSSYTMRKPTLTTRTALRESGILVWAKPQLYSFEAAVFYCLFSDLCL